MIFYTSLLWLMASFILACGIGADKANDDSRQGSSGLHLVIPSNVGESFQHYVVRLWLRFASEAKHRQEPSLLEVVREYERANGPLIEAYRNDPDRFLADARFYFRVKYHQQGVCENDGCGHRAFEINRELENVKGALSLNLEVKQIVGLFPEGAPWRFHVASHIQTASGKHVIDNLGPGVRGADDWQRRFILPDDRVFVTPSDWRVHQTAQAEKRVTFGPWASPDVVRAELTQISVGEGRSMSLQFSREPRLDFAPMQSRPHVLHGQPLHPDVYRVVSSLVPRDAPVPRLIGAPALPPRPTSGGGSRLSGMPIVPGAPAPGRVAPSIPGVPAGYGRPPPHGAAHPNPFTGFMPRGVW